MIFYYFSLSLQQRVTLGSIQQSHIWIDKYNTISKVIKFDHSSKFKTTLTILLISSKLTQKYGKTSYYL